MSAAALALTLSAAAVHAAWNLRLKAAADSQTATAVALAVGVVAFAPFAGLFWRLGPAAVPYAGASAALELLYFALLGIAYRLADLSLVYPVARGSAPVLVLSFALATGVRSSAVQIAGVTAIVAGVWLVRGRAGATNARMLFLAAAIGCAIAAYTLVDARGVRHANPVAYLEVVLAPAAVVYLLATVRQRGRAALAAAADRATLGAGLGIFGAYALALLALRYTAVSNVAAVRELSIVMAAIAARVFLGERNGRRRLLGAALATIGAAMIALG